LTVTTEEAAEIAGVSVAQIRKWVLLGWLTPVRRGARPLRFVYDDVAKCQRDHRTQAWEDRHAAAVQRWVLAPGAHS
jgi:predicted site-specific integrase-resolvase